MTTKPQILTISDHMRAIEALGGVPIVWVADDMPGSTQARREEQLSEIAADLESVCISAGSEYIDMECDGEEGEDEEEAA